MKPKESPRYEAYVLRSWQVQDTQAGASSRRFSLEDSHSGEKHGFADLEVLLSYLRSKLGSGPQSM